MSGRPRRYRRSEPEPARRTGSDGKRRFVYPDVGARLRAARIAAGLTQTEVAERMLVGPVTVTNAERDGVSYLPVIERYAQVLGVRPAWLAFG